MKTLIRYAILTFAVCALCLSFSACEKSERTDHRKTSTRKNTLLLDYVKTPLDKANAAAGAVEDRDTQIKRQLGELE